MNSEMLLKARAYEEEEEKGIAECDRPAFHLSPRAGWMNDPNGFSWYAGQYHLFYQYYPYGTRWKSMHWGHAVSDDLLHWKYLPAALAPDQPYDRSGCFSGSAVELPDGRQLLMYTGVAITNEEEKNKEELQTQCLAVGDGLNYEKFAANPVLDERNLPEGGSAGDFRDPKLWMKADGSFRAVVANRAADGTGQILLFGSENGWNWSFRRVLAENKGRYGRMWECPDFFMLDGKAVLLISPQDMLETDDGFHSGSNNICMIGSYDEDSEIFTEEHVQIIDDGVDYYAMQTALMPDGRRIMMAWMQNWDTQEHQPGEKWFGQMALPRELFIRNGHLYQRPVREIESLRLSTAAYAGVHVSGSLQLEGIRGRYADMTIALRPGEKGTYDRFAVTLAQDGTIGTTLCYEPKKGLLTIDRSRSGTRRAFAHRRGCRIESEHGELRLRVILDRNSVEVFAGEGKKALTMSIPTDARADGITFEATGEAVMDVTLHRLA